MVKRKKKSLLEKTLRRAFLGKKPRRTEGKLKRVKKVPIANILEARRKATAERIARTKAFLEASKRGRRMK